MDHYQTYLQLFNEYLDKQKFLDKPAKLYNPIVYTLKSGGKRIRPILCLMACGIFGKDAKAALPAAMAIELFHNFTLVHDDIMDDAPLRRGRPTVFKKDGLNAAILSGDLIFIKAYSYLTKLESSKLQQIFELFNKTATEVCEGQQYDMDFEESLTVSTNEYIKMIELKTAVLLAASLQIGTIVGGSSWHDQLNIYEFGRNIGIAFQLMDDLLDTYGEGSKVGKQIGGDIFQNKKTYLFIKAWEQANMEEKKCLEKWYSIKTTNDNAKQKIREVMAIFTKYKVEQLTRKEMNKYYKNAQAHLKSLRVKTVQLVPVNALVQMLMKRDA